MSDEAGETVDEVRDLVRRLDAGALSRGAFVKRTAALGLSLSLISAILVACGGDDGDAELPGESLPDPLSTETVTATETSAQPAGSSAETAVAAAQQFGGITLNVTWESGVPASNPKSSWVPEWEELTGITINTVELDRPDLFAAAIAEHVADSGAFDILSIEPAWIPDLLAAGVVEPIDELASQYLDPLDLEDYHPLYRDIATWRGQRFGFFDDGDTHILYFRKDIFDELGLGPPRTWDELVETAAAINGAKAPDIWGVDFWRTTSFQHWAFLPAFQAQGGRPFNPENMEPELDSEIGLLVLNQLLSQNEVAPPDVLDHDPIHVVNSWLEGTAAMILWWPTAGRWAAGYGGAGDEGFEVLSESQIVDKVGYTTVPGGHGQHASGYVLALGADSPNSEAAYLTMQWATSPGISLKRLTQPQSLRDPYRISHFRSDTYRALWPDASRYLETLNAAAGVALTDFMIPGWQEYALALADAVAATYKGSEPSDALDAAVGEWNEITDRIGRDSQVEMWNSYLEVPGSSPANVAAG